MRSLLFVLALVPIAAFSLEGHAEPRVARSNASRGHLLELFTSEGCSSCPPMEAWLESHHDSLRDQNVVALAFHVDYWDGIGWKDPFSSPRWTARQERVAATSRSGLYTPELALDGVETRRDGAYPSSPASTHIELSARQEGELVVATPHVTGAPADARLFVALREDGLVVDVPRGENAGRRLAHDAVVRALVGPLALDAEARLPIPLGARRDKLSVVAFVEAPGSTRVLEAVAISLR